MLWLTNVCNGAETRDSLGESNRTFDSEISAFGDSSLSWSKISYWIPLI